MIRAGLCSVALRQQARTDVVRIAAASKLSIIEWGGDVHVPPGDHSAALEARTLCEDAGLVTASYGSYFKPGVHGVHEFEPVLATAQTLGASRIRVWAGTYGSRECPTDERVKVVDTLNAVAATAAAADVSIVLEHHGGTLADSAAATLHLLDEVANPNVAAYWQPALGLSDESALKELDVLTPRIEGIHLFCWTSEEQRFPLSTRADLWRGVFSRVNRPGRTVDAFLEFVPNDDPDAVPREAAALIEYVQGQPVQ